MQSGGRSGPTRAGWLTQPSADTGSAGGQHRASLRHQGVLLVPGLHMSTRAARLIEDEIHHHQGATWLSAHLRYPQPSRAPDTLCAHLNHVPNVHARSTLPVRTGLYVSLRPLRNFQAIMSSRGAMRARAVYLVKEVDHGL
jgi:hypothetical protein